MFYFNFNFNFFFFFFFFQITIFFLFQFKFFIARAVVTKNRHWENPHIADVAFNFNFNR